MSILFRITEPADDALSPSAIITARKLAALRRFLRSEGDRIGLALLEPDEYLGDSFEALRVALTSDQGVELDLAYGNAYALLEALAIEAESVGDIPVELLRARLSDPATPGRAALRGVDHYLPRLERLVASAQARDDARFAWA